jgi:hypothetical protein
MNSTQPKRTSAWFEYFLYVAIIVETALAALVYKVILQNRELARFSVWFGLFYFVFLGWAIAQLNILHRDRKPPVIESAEAEPIPQPAPPEEDGAPDTPAPRGAGVAPEHTPGVLGFTAAQLAIVLLVFATAIATFSWALRLLP